MGVLNALYAYKGIHVDAEKLARQACQIEIEILKNPMGKQDQYASAYGGLNTIQFNSDESVFIDPIIFNETIKKTLESKFMMFYTGVERLSSHILGAQESNISSNQQNLQKVVDIAHKGISALRNNKIDQIGELLHENWEQKKQFASNVSNQQLDDIYHAGRNAGAVGGKVLGAGGGGFFLFYCEPKYQPQVRKALCKLKETRFMYEGQGSKIIYVNNGDQY